LTGRLVLAVDIGGTKLAAATVDGDGAIRRRAQRPTPAGDDVVVWAAVAALLGDVAGGDRLHAVGIGSAGPVHLDSGEVSPVNITAWRRFPLVARVRALFPDRPVVLAGDGICMALGEHRSGAGRGVDDVLGVVVSTGVGGGLILGGRVHHGPSGNAGHVGHLVVDPDGPPCPCGGRGCVEAIASGPSLLAWAVEQGWSPARGALSDVPSLAGDAGGGHDVALAAFARAGRALGVAVTTVAATVDIRRAVVGGGVANVGDLLLAPARAAVAEHARLPFLDGLEIVPAALGGDAGLLGAAALALDAVS
jgi:glucokinase